MLKEYRKNRDAYYAGISFCRSLCRIIENVEYHLRFPYDDAPGTRQQDRDTDKCYQKDGLGTCNGNDYFLKGFLSLQALVDEALLK